MSVYETVPTNEQIQIQRIAGKSWADSPQTGVRSMLRGLRRDMAFLRRHYTRASVEGFRSPADEWLCDNYYVLEKEGKSLRGEIRRQSRAGSQEELMAVYTVFREVLRDRRPPLTDGCVLCVLRAAGEAKPLSERQFAFVPAAIVAALIRMARDAVEAGDGERMAYAITSFGKVSAIDLETIIHQCSGVERILKEDPAGVYSRMSDESRAHYRHLTAQIARKTRVSEEDVARLALEEARLHPEGGGHIGFPLARHPALLLPRRRRGRAAVALNAVLPLLLSLALAWRWGVVWLTPLLYLPLFEALRTLIQQAALSAVDVDFIPRMDLTKVEKKPKTVALVSTLLPKVSDAPALAERLERLYFQNSDPDLYYCVLADFKEWDYPTDEKDESQVQAARRAIRSLNERLDNRFMLYLRGRTYNRTQRKYSGWERKRGAITEFIRFLKGKKTSAHTFVGDSSVFPEVRYIIALDADTGMLYESAEALVSAALHPLNRPVAGADGVVTSGYGVLVPRMSPDLRSAGATAFSRVMSGCGGVTAYETREKDFYQDLFGESIFAGKGLIDVDAFHSLLDDRFPENRVLSHDILEGAYLRCGFVSDVEMTDSAPLSMASWLSRLHRWLRGDWQNIVFLASSFRDGDKRWENPIGRLSKYKLLDNLRRSLTPVASFVCLVAAVAAPPLPSALLAWAGALGVAFPSLWAAAWSLQSGGFFTLSRKFFTRTLPHTFELMAQALLLLIMLPAQALGTLDAVLRSLWRTFVSRKGMLEWVTAAQADAAGGGFRGLLQRFWLPELVGIAYLILTRNTPLVALGLLFAAVIPVAGLTARTSREEESRLTPDNRDALLSYNAAMWRYYEEFANRSNNYLPPDNIQQSPVFRVAARTSPTNIGMLLLSTLAARDMDLIDSAGLYVRLERTLRTVEELPKWNGNLYNWYDTETLDTLKPEFVSTVDSGNFVCCLVALREGIREYLGECAALMDLLPRLGKLIDETDLTGFYNKKKKLFSIGWDVPTNRLVDSHYDFLMSEARLTSYYAVARKIVGKKHWGALGRAMSRWGGYAGPVSWTGTMFEYFMPHLLLPVYQGSLLGESLSYCLYCHKRRARAAGVPWGVSESAFYAFDNNLNYQYKAHGVQRLGVKRHLDQELVISPYSTFLTIPLSPNSSMGNLRLLRELGVYGRYGFFEAVDFTPERVGAGLAVTRSYMAHHIGMSMVASCNALFGNAMQKRFMADYHMRSAEEFLQEKIAKNTVVYDQVKNPVVRDQKQERPRLGEERGDISPTSPRCALLTNGELTDILTDTGAGYLMYGGCDLTRRDTDLLRRAQGVLTVARMDGATLPSAMAPFYDAEAEYSVEQQERAVTYLAKKGSLELGVRCLIHPTISCEQRQIVVKNKSSLGQMVQLLVYFEPVLSPHRDYAAHPAYSKLFVTAHRDRENEAVTFGRRERDGGTGVFLAAGFLEELEFELETRREALMSGPEGLRGLLRFPERGFDRDSAGVPDACCAMRLSLMLSPGSQRQVTLLLAPARSREEAVRSLIAMRRMGSLEPREAAISPLLGQSLEARIGETALGQMLFTEADSGPNRADKSRNRLGQRDLWATGLSGDLPIALLELGRDGDGDAVAGYLRLHASLRNLSVEFDLCILCPGEAERDWARPLAERHSPANLIGARGGVFLLVKDQLSPEQLTLIRAVARHTAQRSRTEGTPRPFRPAELRPVSPEPMPEQPELWVEGGAFQDGWFHVDKQSPLPWSHILANGRFGTLVSDKALGYTWALNSRENKLTPWYNDIATGNDGELCILHDGEGYYNLCDGARASFSAEGAGYRGKTSKVRSQLSVTVDGAFCRKRLDLTLQNRTDRPVTLECAYYLEPVLGVDRETARHIHPEIREGVLLLHNPYHMAVKGWAALTAEGMPRRFTVDRAAFLSGDWQNRDIGPENDPCAAVIVNVTLPPQGGAELRFTLTYGATAESALLLAKEEVSPPPRPGEPAKAYLHMETPDERLNQFINHFAPHQILAGRIHGRTAFYQCGGAFGFRDQLQDVMAYGLLDPQLWRNQIIRCCSVQFEQGDVLHWWHDLPARGGGVRGVRTRFSDDLLWLPLAAAEYVERTGDHSLLRVPVSYLEAEELPPGVQERYIQPGRGLRREDVYTHCLRALDRGYNLGEDGLPLIGCGDWCDGFSGLGREGRGRSVWMALFLALTLDKFAEICALRGDTARRRQCRERAEALRRTVDAAAWDGAWYLRAFSDAGEKIGGQESPECRIDLLPQTFAVFAGMPDSERVARGLQSALDQLVDHRLRLVRLFTPAFQHSHLEPGYVKAYPEGIRENGGQYTHAAVWFAAALFLSGRTEDGWRILEMLNPVNRAAHPELARDYKLEPYSMAADIYTNPDAPGRGGWSLYTGAASWYYRTVYEVLLGLRVRGDRLELAPRLPEQWPSVSLRARIRDTDLVLRIRREGAPGLICDGHPASFVPLDGGSHEAELVLADLGAEEA